jgi:hypothetical protein
MSEAPPELASSPASTAGDARGGSVSYKVEIEYSGDIRQRVVVDGSPEQVLKVGPAVVQLVRDTMKEVERARIRRRFAIAAHVLVFGVAALSIVGLVLDFVNFRDFNTGPLFAMGGWVVGGIIYFYLAIIKDVFGLKVSVPKPPTLSSGKSG